MQKTFSANKNMNNILVMNMNKNFVHKKIPTNIFEYLNMLEYLKTSLDINKTFSFGQKSPFPIVSDPRVDSRGWLLIAVVPPQRYFHKPSASELIN